jgi:hypothetical protein
MWKEFRNGSVVYNDGPACRDILMVYELPSCDDEKCTYGIPSEIMDLRSETLTM